MDRVLRLLTAVILSLANLPMADVGWAATVIAVGARWSGGGGDGASSKPVQVIAQYREGEWTELALPSEAETTAFVGATVNNGRLWVYGVSETRGPLLIASDDGGETWTDATSSIPDQIRAIGRVVDLAFVNPEEGWLLSATANGVGPVIAQTKDAGGTWSLLEADGIIGLFALGRRGQTVELFQYDPLGTRVSPVTSAGGALALTASTLIGPGNAYFTPAAFATTEDAAWAVGTSAGSPAVVVTRGTSEWTEQRLVPGRGTLRALHFLSNTLGITGGWLEEKDTIRPFVACTIDRGDTWVPAAELPALPPGDFRRTLRVSDTTAFAVVKAWGAVDSILVQSDDSCRTWRPTPSPFFGKATIRALALGPG